MKLSLKLQDPHHNTPTTGTTQTPLLLRAKIPITVFGLPFLSAFSATDNPSNLSLSLRTNFPSAPSLQLSYTPTTPSTATGTTSAAPLTLTLKSGVNLYGSPNNSPLIISAHFSFSPNNYNPNPTFSLQFKPQIGSFSFRKTTVSNPSPNPKPNSGVGSFGFVPLERSGGFKDLTMDSVTSKDSIFSGILVMAKTEMPVTKRVAVNLRWGVNVPGDYGKQLPYLRVNKIGIQRIDEVKEEKGVKDKDSDSRSGEVEMLKGLCSWMRRELDGLQKENREMKSRLEEVRLGNSVRNSNNYGYGSYGGSSGGGKKSVPVVEKSGGFEEWRSKKSGGAGEENGWNEIQKKGASASDVESELQRAIMAAST